MIPYREAKLPPQAKKVAVKDLQRLKRMGPFSPEHGVIRSWLELISELPWARASQETLDIHKARKVSSSFFAPEIFAMQA